MGRLIPAGTGMEYYRNVRVDADPTMHEARPEVEDTQSYLDQLTGLNARPSVPVPDVEPEEEPEEEEDDSEITAEADAFIGEFDEE